MNAIIDKSQVEKQFSRAASSYNSAASVQKHMSDQLIEQLNLKFADKPINSITDFGCGTGLSLYELSRKHLKADLTAIDLSPAMLEQAKTLIPQANLLCADMEEYTSPVPQDLIFSNASIQWCNFRKVLNKVHASLNTNGIFAFSSFGPGTHKELAQAWRTVDDHEHQIGFMTMAEHAQSLREADFIILHQQSDIKRLAFDSPEALLASIKKTGATNAVTNRVRGLLSRERYKRFLVELEINNPLALSYETLSFVAQKL